MAERAKRSAGRLGAGAALVVMLLSQAPGRAGKVPATLDAGPTLPIQQFLAERMPEAQQTLLLSDYAVEYPVHTAGLAIGRLHWSRLSARMPEPYAQWLTQPVALIGDDRASREWLTQQGDALRASGASILVVRVQSAERMRSLRAVRTDLPMAPGAVPQLADALRQAGVAVYPLVILPDGSLTQNMRARALKTPGAAQ